MVDNNNNPLILVVDDDVENINIVVENLKHNFRIVPALSGKEALDLAQQHQPKLILLDVVMPEVGGLDVCRQLKNNDTLHHIPIIFLSSNHSLDDRLEGYAAGGDDYIAKPFEKSEITAKINAALVRIKRLDKAHSKISDDHKIKNDLINTVGEMGAITHFLRSTFSCKDYQALADKVIETHQDLDLDVSMEFLENDQYSYYQTGAVDNPLENGAFDFIRDKGRLVDFGVRTAVNYPRVSLIIRNMPIHDSEFYGRVKDYIALIAQGIDSKILSLEAEQKVKNQYQNIQEIFGNTKTTLGQIDEDYKKQQQRNADILSDIGGKIESSFMHLGLTGEQEEFLISVINNAEQKTNRLYEEGLEIGNSFDLILTQMQSALDDNITEDTIDETVEDINFF